MSSQDLSPAPYPFFAGSGNGQGYAIPATRSRERYWLYGLLLALTLLTTTVVGAGMQSDFQRNIPFDIERSYSQYAAVLAASGASAERVAVFADAVDHPDGA